MATRFGGQVYAWLLDRGWKPVERAEDQAHFVCGDPTVSDPVTNEETGIYEAAKLHRERTGEYPDFLPESW